MLSLSQVEDQLKRVGCNFRFWCQPEIRELCKILMPGETVAQAVVGRYENGFALLVATDHRLLLIDKKPLFLTLEDIRFDMISEIDYSAQFLDGTLRIMTPNRKLSFMSWNQGRLRKVLDCAQQRVSEIRQHYMPRPSETQHDWVGAAGGFQRDEHYSAPVVGGLALQGNTDHGDGPHFLPFNPYTNSSVLIRRRRVPKFY